MPKTLNRTDCYRAWIFSYVERPKSNILVPGRLSYHREPLIVTGHDYVVQRVFGPDEAIEADASAEANRVAQSVVEFHYCIEATTGELGTVYRMARRAGSAATIGHTGFWIEPLTLASSDQWRVSFMVRPLVPMVDLLALRLKCERPGRARLMVSEKVWRMDKIHKMVDTGAW